MKTYTAAYAKRKAEAFQQKHFTSCISIFFLDKRTYRLFVFQGDRRVLAESGRLPQLEKAKNDALDKYLDAALLEMVVESGDVWLGGANG